MVWLVKNWGILLKELKTLDIYVQEVMLLIFLLPLDSHGQGLENPFAGATREVLGCASRLFH